MTLRIYISNMDVSGLNQAQQQALVSLAENIESAVELGQMTIQEAAIVTITLASVVGRASEKDSWSQRASVTSHR